MSRIHQKHILFCITDMARDTAVGREHVLIVPSSLTLDGGTPQQSGMAQTDINQQILEVSSITVFKVKYVFICAKKM